MPDQTAPPDDLRLVNQPLWDSWAAVNHASANYDVEGFKAGGVRLRQYELDEIGDVAGKDLLHLQCHFGIDTLSWGRLGARVTGMDYSERAIADARALAVEIGQPATFVCCDVLDLPANLEGDFDVVYTSRGVLGWLGDLERWAQVIAHFLRPGGTFYITEMHPFVWPFDDSGDTTELRVRFPYFPRSEPVPFPVKGSYADPDADVEQTHEYVWPHSIGEIVTALASAGLRINFLHEWPFLAWRLPFLVEHPDGDDTWQLPEQQTGEIPLMFSLKATKG